MQENEGWKPIKQSEKNCCAPLEQGKERNKERKAKD